MTQAVVLRTISIDEYYYADTLVHSDLRHEFVDGVMVAMTGGSPEHAHLSAQLITQLGGQLVHKPCKLYSADLRVRVKKLERVFCPDVVLQCGTPLYDQDDRHGKTLVNPLIICEVLSPSTQRYDYQTKLPSYQFIDSLRTIVFVHQARRCVETWVRLPSNMWEWNAHEAGVFELIGVNDTTLDVDGLYSQTDFKR